MPTWGWIVIGVAAVVIVVLLVLLVVMHQRSSRLRQRFGPEYERTVEATGGRRDAEAVLEQREARRATMDIRSLPEPARLRYEQDWRQIQTQFVDDPFMAVAAADQLIQSVMRDEGYPVEDFDQRAEDLSVDHPTVVENYREGHRLAMANANRQGAGTEGLRQAMQHYRTLFIDLTDRRAESDGRSGTEGFVRARPAGAGPNDDQNRMVR